MTRKDGLEADIKRLQDEIDRKKIMLENAKTEICRTGITSYTSQQICSGIKGNDIRTKQFSLNELIKRFKQYDLSITEDGGGGLIIHIGARYIGKMVIYKDYITLTSHLVKKTYQLNQKNIFIKIIKTCYHSFRLKLKREYDTTTREYIVMKSYLYTLNKRIDNRN